MPPPRRRRAGRQPSEAREALVGRRRLGVGALAAVLVVLVAVAVGRGDDGDPPTTWSATIRADAWAPYWAFDRSTGDLADHGSRLHEVSPFAYLTRGATDIGLDPAAADGTFDEFVQAARASGIAVVPSVLDVMDDGGMADLLADADQRRAHVRALVELAAQTDADGLDIDYERFAFADDRSTWATTRPLFSAFVQELASALHAEGRTLTVSIPPVYDDGTGEDSGYWVYDYAAIARSADRIRVMAYDYSGQAAGPVSPIDWVRRSIDGVVEAAGGPERIVLGIPLYGNNVPIGTDGTCPDDGAVGRTAVTVRSVGELIERRGATPEYDASTDEWTFVYELELTGTDASGSATTCTQTRQVNYVDAAGARSRIDMAREAGLAGVSLWALGYEDDSVWTAIEPVLTPARR